VELREPIFSVERSLGNENASLFGWILRRKLCAKVGFVI
jgi:hypothetical protein